MEFFSLQAGKGDAFIIKWKNISATKYLLVDSGIPNTYFSIKEYVRAFGNPHAIIVTHVDWDHISGMDRLFADESISSKSEILTFVNTPELILFPPKDDKVALEHGKVFLSTLNKHDVKHYGLYLGSNKDNTIEISGLKLTVISPPSSVLQKLMSEWSPEMILQKHNDESQILNMVSNDKEPIFRSYEDIVNEEEKPHSWESDLINATSIAFIADDGIHKVLMLGDSLPELIYEELCRLGYSENNKLSVDLVKISHHGCRNNTSKSLLKLIDCKKYLISTNGSGPYYHPHRETIVRIAEFGRENKDKQIEVFLNYPIDTTAFVTEQEQKDWKLDFKTKNDLLS